MRRSQVVAKEREKPNENVYVFHLNQNNEHENADERKWGIRTTKILNLYKCNDTERHTQILDGSY